MKRLLCVVSVLPLLLASACAAPDLQGSDVDLVTPKGQRVGRVAVPIAFVSQVGTNPEGYYLLDADNARVVLIDSAGQVLRTLGRHGGAPGEFRYASAAASTSDGILAVLDMAEMTLFASNGTFVKRFSVRPSLGSVRWVCGDSLLAFVPFGDVSSKRPLVALYARDGRLVRETGIWPSWSTSMNNSISQLAMTESDCVLTLVEAFGTKLGRLSLTDSAPHIEQQDVPWPGNAAEAMTVAVKAGLSPEKALTRTWTNASVWRLGGDSLLVRQDSIAPDRGRFHRYMISDSGVTKRSRPTDFIIWQIRKGTCVFTRSLVNGDIEIGTFVVDDLLKQFRDASPSTSRE